MPIKSFVVHPKPGEKKQLLRSLESLDECEVIPSSNQDVIVLVTETESKEHDIELQEKIEALDSLQMLSMVSGFNNSEYKSQDNV